MIGATIDHFLDGSKDRTKGEDSLFEGKSADTGGPIIGKEEYYTLLLLAMVAISVLDSLLGYLRTGQDDNGNNSSQEFRFVHF